MRNFLLVGAAMAVAVACKGDDVLENTGDASPGGGAGGSGGASCQFDDWRIAMAGAVHEDPVVPEPGSWCPSNGIEICTAQGASATTPTPETDAGAPEPGGVVSRCVDNAWQTLAGSSCENTRENCNVFNYRDYDGQCCVHLRNCRRGFCDGERWWTLRE